MRKAREYPLIFIIKNVVAVYVDVPNQMSLRSMIKLRYGVLAKIHSTLLGFNTSNRGQQDDDKQLALYSAP